MTVLWITMCEQRRDLLVLVKSRKQQISYMFSLSLLLLFIYLTCLYYLYFSSTDYFATYFLHCLHICVWWRVHWTRVESDMSNCLATCLAEDHRCLYVSTTCCLNASVYVSYFPPRLKYSLHGRHLYLCAPEGSFPFLRTWLVWQLIHSMRWF